MAVLKREREREDDQCAAVCSIRGFKCGCDASAASFNSQLCGVSFRAQIAFSVVRFSQSCGTTLKQDNDWVKRNDPTKKIAKSTAALFNSTSIGSCVLDANASISMVTSVQSRVAFVRSVDVTQVAAIRRVERIRHCLPSKPS